MALKAPGILFLLTLYMGAIIGWRYIGAGTSYRELSWERKKAGAIQTLVRMLLIWGTWLDRLSSSQTY